MNSKYTSTYVKPHVLEALTKGEESANIQDLIDLKGLFELLESLEGFEIVEAESLGVYFDVTIEDLNAAEYTSKSFTLESKFNKTLKRWELIFWTFEKSSGWDRPPAAYSRLNTVMTLIESYCKAALLTHH